MDKHDKGTERKYQWLEKAVHPVPIFTELTLSKC